MDDRTTRAVSGIGGRARAAAEARATESGAGATGRAGVFGPAVGGVAEAGADVEARAGAEAGADVDVLDGGE